MRFANTSAMSLVLAQRNYMCGLKKTYFLATHGHFHCRVTAQTLDTASCEHLSAAQNL
jgi:hypothetical protein